MISLKEGFLSLDEFNWPSPFSVQKKENKLVPPELLISFLLNIFTSLLLSLIFGWLQVIFHTLHSLKKPVDLYNNYEKLKFFGQYAEHDWKYVILKPIHSKRVDHHVRVACVQKNSNLLRYFKNCIAIDISYWASPIEHGSNQFVGQKHHNCGLSRNLKIMSYWSQNTMIDLVQV